MKHIKTRFDKHDIPDLPKAEFQGRIITVVSPGEAERAVDYLLSQPILGLDTETRPSFQPGRGMNKVALLQVSTPDTCFLFRLCQMGMPPCIIRLLEDTTVTKIGLSWHDDIMQLHRRQDFTPGTFVELQQLVNLIGVKDLSLAKIFANLFGQRISKTQRLTNWEADILTPGQKVYAATDAWACIEIYREIMRLHDTQDFELEIIPEPEPPMPAEPKKKEGEKDNKKKKEDKKTGDKANGASKKNKKLKKEGAKKPHPRKKKPKKPAVVNPSSIDKAVAEVTQKAQAEQSTQTSLAEQSSQSTTTTQTPKIRKYKRKPKKQATDENPIS